MIQNKNELISPSFLQTASSGSITITKGKNEDYRKFYLKSTWFDECEYYKFKSYGDYLLIRKYRLDTPKKVIKINKIKSFEMVINAPLGTFHIEEEESGEDEVILYYS